MLNSTNIKAYTELLTPPEGFETEQALGLTYSMDLTMVLSCAVSLFLSKEMLEDLKGERYDVITALGEAKDKLRIYGHYGRISIPETYSKVFTLLEPSIKSVSNLIGSFHPKVWLIKYRSKNSDKRIYRLIVMSKNITDTNDWDITYHADGKYKSGSYNQSLISFIKSINCKKEDNSFIFDIIKDLEKIEFDKPDGVSKIKFLGFPDYNFSFPKKMVNTVIISPFLSGHKLEEIRNKSLGDIYLLSREEELNKIKDEVLRKFKCYVLKDEIIYGMSILDSSKNDNSFNQVLMNLHAKCYIWEEGNSCHIILGSNNCSISAFKNNQEAAIEMVISKNNICVLDFLEELVDENSEVGSDYDKKNGDIKLFKPYIRVSQELEFESEETKIVDEIRHYFEACPLTGQIEKIKDDSSYNVTIKCNLTSWSFDPDWNVKVSLISNKAIKKKLESVIVFDNLDIESLTSFLAIYIEYKGNSVCSYLVKAEYENYSTYFSQIESNIISNIFNDTNKIVNYITWLLQSTNEGASNLPIYIESTNNGKSKNGVEFNNPLYESLLLVAAKEPKKLLRINKVIETLNDNENIPVEELRILQDFWKPFQNYIEGVK